MATGAAAVLLFLLLTTPIAGMSSTLHRGIDLLQETCFWSRFDGGLLPDCLIASSFLICNKRIHARFTTPFPQSLGAPTTGTSRMRLFRLVCPSGHEWRTFSLATEKLTCTLKPRHQFPRQPRSRSSQTCTSLSGRRTMLTWRRSMTVTHNLCWKNPRAAAWCRK